MLHLLLCLQLQFQENTVVPLITIQEHLHNVNASFHLQLKTFSEIERIGKTDKTGTKVVFYPDDSIFQETKYDFEIIDSDSDSDIDISDPRYATAIGLVKYAGQNLDYYNTSNSISFIEVVKRFFKKIINNK